MNPLAVFTAALDKVRAGVGMLLPIFSDAADFRTWPGWLRWAVHLLLLGLVLGILVYVVQPQWGWVNDHLKRVSTQVQPYYLALVFLLFYAFCWVAYGLIRAFAADEGAAEFPDLERAWKAAVADLARAGVRLDDPDAAPPVFLVLGRPAGGMDALFQAAGLGDKPAWKFRLRSPAEPNARLVVYTCFDPYAVFVTVPDASGWAYLCAALAGDNRYAPPADSQEAGDPAKTLSFGTGDLQQLGLSASENYELEKLLRRKRQRELSEAEQDRLRILSDKGNRGAGPAGGGRPFTIRADALRAGERELRFVSTLIARDRWPLCPVNGVLVLVPWAAGESEAVAEVAARELAANLSAARDVFRLHYPTTALVCDLDTARGFGQFRAGFQSGQLVGRIGQRLPQVPAQVEGAPPPRTIIERGVRWIAHAVMPVWTLNALGREGEESDWYDTNRELYLLMREVHRRVPRFATILGRVPGGQPGPDGGEDDLEGLPLLGGCYLGGTGTKELRQAFVTGVFQKLVDDQAAVAWTRRAHAADRRFRRLAWVGYAAAAVLAAVVVAAASLS